MTKSDDGENLMGCVERRLYKEKILLDRSMCGFIYKNSDD